MIIRLTDCQVSTMLSVIRGKWKPIIIKALEARSLGYGELRRTLPEPSQKVMTTHLRELEKDKIISRTVRPGRVVRVEYSLTEHGASLLPVLRAMAEWGKGHRDLVRESDAGKVLKFSSETAPVSQFASESTSQSM